MCTKGKQLQILNGNSMERKPTYRFQSNQLQDGTGLCKDGVSISNCGNNTTRTFCDATQAFCNLVDAVTTGQQYHLPSL
ncbi:hypothetical protein OUZ56_029303 [Daphnia magna]|uniref:Uncharacterized protein n=1 Tax=Daphnia magna TaxID=35525 RepID=A0ABR0B6G0_9CRUS|nr:hypothetical protein OUZ56_029303 [Daphnia magna]